MNDYGTGGTVNLNLRDALTISGTNSGISGSLGTRAVGRGGDITIQPGEVFVTNDGRINSNTSGTGNGGNITVNATNLVEFIDGHLSSNTALDGGRSGDINITTRRLISKNSQIGTTTLGEGNAGNLTVIASDVVELSGEIGKGDVNGFPGLLSAQVESTGKGQGGNLYLETRHLSVSDGSKIQVATFGAGNAGNLFVRADEIDLFLTDRLSFYSTGLFAGNQLDRRIQERFIPDPNNGKITGQGGNLTIETRTLSLRNGGQVFVETSGEGNAERAVIQASDSVNVTGTSITPTGTQIFSNITAATSNTSTGNGGSLTIETRQLNVTNGGLITSSSNGQGKGGDISITADTARLNNGKITAQTASSDGGNINLNFSQYLLLRNNSLISATAGTAEKGGNDGNITINTPFLIAIPKENSDITANAFIGSGGQVKIKALGVYNFNQRSLQDLEQLLGTKDPSKLNPQLLPTNDITAISVTSPALSGIVQVNTPDIDPSRGLVKLPTVVVNPPRLSQSSCNAFDTGGSSFTVTGRGGLPPSPNEPLTNDVVWSDTRLQAMSDDKPFGFGGDARSPLASPLGRRLAKAALSQSTGTAKTATPSPLRVYAMPQITEKPTAKAKAQPIVIAPATGWVFHDNGEVTLISNASSTTDLGFTPTTCPVR